AAAAGAAAGAADLVGEARAGLRPGDGGGGGAGTASALAYRQLPAADAVLAALLSLARPRGVRAGQPQALPPAGAAGAAGDGLHERLAVGKAALRGGAEPADLALHPGDRRDPLGVGAAELAPD